MALSNAILLGLKNLMVHQKRLEENQDTKVQVSSHRCDVSQLGALREVLQKQENKTMKARTERTNKLKYMGCRHSQWTKIVSLLSTHFQATTRHLSHPNSAQVFQHCFTIFRCIQSINDTSSKPIKPRWLSAICIRGVHSIRSSVHVPDEALKPKAPSVEWFH